MDKGESLLGLITSILDISKIEAGRVRLVLSDVDVAQLLKDAVATVLPIARKKGLKVACEPGGAPRLQGDREKLRQCLVNLERMLPGRPILADPVQPLICKGTSIMVRKFLLPSVNFAMALRAKAIYPILARPMAQCLH
jgi:hypothetical protein